MSLAVSLRRNTRANSRLRAGMFALGIIFLAATPAAAICDAKYVAKCKAYPGNYGVEGCIRLWSKLYENPAAARAQRKAWEANNPALAASNRAV